MAEPLYYLYPTRELNYPIITTDMAIVILGIEESDTDGLSTLAQTIASRSWPQPLFLEPRNWQLAHLPDARRSHQEFRKDAYRLGMGLCVNGKNPWLGMVADEFFWVEDEPGLALYQCPYSQLLPKTPETGIELQLAFQAGVLSWSRTILDVVIWTPAVSSFKTYRPDTVILNQSQTSLKQTWDEFILPRLKSFYTKYLQPLSPENPISGTPIFSPDLSPAELVKLS